MAVSAPDLAIVGRIRKPHGIRGELLVDLATDDPDEVFVPGRRLIVGAPDDTGAPLDRTLTVRAAREFKGSMLVHFTGIDDRNEAENWRDYHLLAPLDELAPLTGNEVYYHELEGMTVHLADGVPLGTVSAFYELPQGITLDVQRADGTSVLIPYREGIVTSVDRGARTITVDPPEGLLE